MEHLDSDCLSWRDETHGKASFANLQSEIDGRAGRQDKSVWNPMQYALLQPSSIAIGVFFSCDPGLGNRFLRWAKSNWRLQGQITDLAHMRLSLCIIFWETVINF